MNRHLRQLEQSRSRRVYHRDPASAHPGEWKRFLRGLRVRRTAFVVIRRRC